MGPNLGLLCKDTMGAGFGLGKDLTFGVMILMAVWPGLTSGMCVHKCASSNEMVANVIGVLSNCGQIGHSSVTVGENL